MIRHGFICFTQLTSSHPLVVLITSLYYRAFLSLRPPKHPSTRTTSMRGYVNSQNDIGNLGLLSYLLVSAIRHISRFLCAIDWRSTQHLRWNCWNPRVELGSPRLWASVRYRPTTSHKQNKTAMLLYSNTAILMRVNIMKKRIMKFFRNASKSIGDVFFEAVITTATIWITTFIYVHIGQDGIIVLNLTLSFRT